MITLNGITLKLGNKSCFKEFSWSLKQNEQWAFVGPNGSGKSVFTDILTGRKALYTGSIQYIRGFVPADDISIVSFDLQKELFDKDNWNDNSDFLESAFDKGTVVTDAILRGRPSSSDFERIIDNLRIRHILQQGIRFLSTGETRKVLIARALMDQPKLLVLDNPFEGLDKKVRKEVEASVNDLYEMNLPIIFNSRRIGELPSAITHIMHFENSEVSMVGEKPMVLAELVKERDKQSDLNLPHHLPGSDSEASQDYSDVSTPLVRLERVTVKYGEKIVLNEVGWKVNPKDHWCISGPNGAGKSTLLDMICGQNSKAYGKEVYLFGKKRGTGETVWDIKAQFGIVSSALQLSYVKGFTAFRVIESGFFDTIGVYDRCSPAQNRIADQWLEILGLTIKRNFPFSKLSFGEQKLILLARAMVKNPRILILDEPCLGLDDTNLTLILKMIDFVAETSNTTILYVSHDPSVTPRCITHHFEFILQGTDQYDYQITHSHSS
ncbi:MAG: ATP-binding cassette domain-containing protein [Proteobacteria bacterium]|nr:ATP-binding cassette domain-containing protein [Pseudomonadota bacterium]